MSMNIFVQLTRPTAQSTSKPRIHMNQVRFVLKFSSLWHCRFARKRSFHRSGKRRVDSRLGGGEVQRIYTMIDDASDKFGDVFFSTTRWELHGVLPCISFPGDTVNGRNPAPPGMSKTL